MLLHHTLFHLIMLLPFPFPGVPYCVVPYPSVPFPVVSYPVVPYLASPYPVIPCPVVPCPEVPRTLCCLALLYRVILYLFPVLFYPVLFLVRPPSESARGSKSRTATRYPARSNLSCPRPPDPGTTPLLSPRKNLKLKRARGLRLEATKEMALRARWVLQHLPVYRVTIFYDFRGETHSKQDDHYSVVRTNQPGWAAEVRKFVPTVMREASVLGPLLLVCALL